MPMLPDPAHMDIIDKACISAFEAEEPIGVFSLCENIMDDPKLPMHCPYHHYLIPAVLLTVAGKISGETAEMLQKRLKTARVRAGTVPGGCCGQFGCCGAAVGAGIFACVWQGSTPLSKTGWAAGNEMTARCLSASASVEGPRCCKRVTYLTLSAALSAAKELLGLDLGEIPEHTCHHFSQSRECRGTACPFFPKKKKAE